MGSAHHSESLKREIASLLKRGAAMADICRDYKLADSTVRRFIRQVEEIDAKNAAYEALKRDCGVKHVPKAVEAVSSQDESVVLAIPDLHCPFEHPDALAFLVAVRDRIRPDKVVCLGDEIDAHAYSKWPKDPDGMGAGQELKAAIEALIPFYVEFPEVQVCISNHTVRPHKMMKAIGLPAAFLPAYETMLNAPDGWKWKEHIIIDNVRYMHGDQGKGGQNGWTKNSEVYHQSVVVGHWHSKAGVYYDSAMFNVNAGCLINDRAYAFDYAKNSHKRPNLGCAVITRGRKATFMPMLTDADGRWIGEL
jgi:hypothetical protein